MKLQFYNTLTRKKELFMPLRQKTVGLYTCGPTVYSDPHIGNLRTYVFEDILKRTLLVAGYRVTHVMNITDVGHLTGDRDMGEDKLQKSAREKRITAWELAKQYTAIFKKNIRDLNILPPDIWCKATSHIKEQIALITRLERAGHTYLTKDGIYFDTSTCADYGKLAHLDIKGLREGARVEPNPEKRHPTDFALWKFSYSESAPSATSAKSARIKRDMEWKSPWGIGFPGWHIECSAMSMKYLGETLDIHCGGVDHIPLHHTNEIAQSESATGKPFARFWLHGAFLIIKKGRMGKSEGNAMTLATLQEKGIDPLAYRYLLLTAHYRSPLNFTWESLEGASHALTNLRNHIRALRPEHPITANDRSLAHVFKKRLAHAISDDLDTPTSLALMWEVLKSALEPRLKKELLKQCDEVFGLGLAKVRAHIIPKEIKQLSKKRDVARKKRAWEDADILRKKIESLGWSVEDTEKGSKINKA